MLYLSQLLDAVRSELLKQFAVAQCRAVQEVNANGTRLDCLLGYAVEGAFDWHPARHENVQNFIGEDHDGDDSQRMEQRHVRVEHGVAHGGAKCDDEQKFKIGIGPDDALGTLLYVRESGDVNLTIRRTFWPQPWQDYADVPRQAVGTQGDAVQIYSDGGNFGRFGELEHHSPSIVQGGPPRSLTESYFTEVYANREGDPSHAA